MIPVHSWLVLLTLGGWKPNGQKFQGLDTCPNRWALSIHKAIEDVESATGKVISLKNLVIRMPGCQLRISGSPL